MTYTGAGYGPEPRMHLRSGGRTACGQLISARMLASDGARGVTCMCCVRTRKYLTHTKGTTMTEQPKETDEHEVTVRTVKAGSGSVLEFEYVNYAGISNTRKVVVIDYRYGRTPYHKDRDQWFLHAFDIDKNAERTFAISDMKAVRVLR